VACCRGRTVGRGSRQSAEAPAEGRRKEEGKRRKGKRKMRKGEKGKRKGKKGREKGKGFRGIRRNPWKN
jgi:hypothetical protein